MSINSLVQVQVDRIQQSDFSAQDARRPDALDGVVFLNLCRKTSHVVAVVFFLCCATPINEAGSQACRLRSLKSQIDMPMADINKLPRP